MWCTFLSAPNARSRSIRMKCVSYCARARPRRAHFTTRNELPSSFNVIAYRISYSICERVLLLLREYVCGCEERVWKQLSTTVIAVSEWVCVWMWIRFYCRIVISISAAKVWCVLNGWLKHKPHIAFTSNFTFVSLIDYEISTSIRSTYERQCWGIFPTAFRKNPNPKAI